MNRKVDLIIVVVAGMLFWGPQVLLAQPDIVKPESPVALVSLATGVELSPARQSVPGGEIDWTRGVVQAVGHASAKPTAARPRAMAQRGAYVVAARNAALVLAGIQVGPGGRFMNFRNGKVRTNIKIKNFRELPSSYNPATRTAKARLEIPIYGISGIVEKLRLEPRPSLRQWAWPAEEDFDESEQSDVIVIDARGLDFSPCLLPNLVTPDGRNVFGADDVSFSELINRPMFRYAVLSQREVIPTESARKYRRMTYRSFTLHPLKNCPAGPGEIVLSPRDLALLETHPDSRSLLQSGKVVIIIDDK